MKFLKIISFLPFFTKIWPWHPSNVAFLDIFTLHFHPGVCTTTTFSFKRYPPCRIWKKPIDNMPVSLLFFTTFNLVWPKFCPKTTSTLIFLLVSNDYSININNSNVGWVRSFLIEKQKWLTHSSLGETIIKNLSCRTLTDDYEQKTRNHILFLLAPKLLWKIIKLALHFWGKFNQQRVFDAFSSSFRTWFELFAPLQKIRFNMTS